MDGPHSAISNLEFFVNGQRIGGSFHKVSIMLANPHAKIGTAAVSELFVEIERAACVIPVLMCVEDVRNGVMGEGGAEEG